MLLTAGDVARQDSFRSELRTFAKLLAFGVAPLVNENDTVATHEIRFGDNDKLAALVAHLVAAFALVLLSDLDALFAADPSQPHALPIPVVGDIDELNDEAELPGINGRRTKGLVAEYGAGLDREVVHRDDLIVKSRKKRK